jgi:hypothetical protein
MTALRSILRTTTAFTQAAWLRGKSGLKTFRSDNSGAVAIIFGLVMIPVIGIAGASLDYSRASQDRTHTLAAADSAALAGVRALRGSDAQVEQTIRDYLDANLPPHLVGIPFTYVVNPERTGIRVDVAGRTDTTLLERCRHSACGLVGHVRGGQQFHLHRDRSGPGCHRVDALAHAGLAHSGQRFCRHHL